MVKKLEPTEMLDLTGSPSFELHLVRPELSLFMTLHQNATQPKSNLDNICAAQFR